jgi:hypothetical protein
LLFALRDQNPNAPLWRRALDGSTLPLALILAGCWLSDGPVGVMACYLLAAIALTASALNRSWAHLLRATIAAALGIGLPGLYLIPAAWEQRWVDLRAAINLPVFSVENNWLFARHTDPRLVPFDGVLHRASMLAVIMIGVALVGAAVLWLRRKSAGAGLSRRWWIPLALIPAAVLFLELPISLAVWNLLPKLRFLQYPWRWVLVVEAPMAIFFAAAVWPSRTARGMQRAAVGALCAVVFLTTTFFAGRTFLRACNEGDTMADLLDSYRGGGGLEGTDEYEPPESDHWKIATGLPDACLSASSDTVLGVGGADGSIPAWHADQGSCEFTATAQLRESEHLRIGMVAPHAGFLILRLLRYPAWRITVNGQHVEAGDPDTDPRDDGLIAVRVPQGPVQLAVDWTSTPDVIAGRCLSGLALMLLIAIGWVERKLGQSRQA